MAHPYERFTAPSSIAKGSVLGEVLNKRAVALIAESLQPHVPGFNRAAFVRAANTGLSKLTLTQRAQHIADAIRAQSPDDPREALAAVVASLGPPVPDTEGTGLKKFFYLPHSAFIAGHADLAHAQGLEACYAVTRRFTAEWCIRPYLVAKLKPTLTALRKWTRDPDPHVRRLVSEGTRPRLPWGSQLKMFIDDPAPAMALLEKLKDDPELYVRRSVANHLGDVAKDNPATVFSLCERWLHEANNARDPERAENRRWVVRHALRHPWKHNDPDARRLRLAAGFVERKQQR